MKRTAAAVMASLAVAASASTATSRAPDTGREWHFRVLLDDQEVGWHRYVVRTDDEATEVESRAQFDVRVLFVNAYRYRHEARERWQGACLEGLASRTVTNGQVEDVDAVATDEALVVARRSGETRLPGCVMSFAYWDPRILQADRLLNPQTGEWLPVRIETRGTEQVSVSGRTVTATRHRLSAPEMQIDLWYADGLWVGLEAAMRGGRLLRYELQ
ncbi:MAG TPA: DUF6134 family protein [Steroidobacteraceae bacterium]|nr:DUF6134 family protein [Steroidobacteraceae bacterium]